MTCMPVPVLQSSYCLLASKRSLDVEMTAGQFAFFSETVGHLELVPTAVIVGFCLHCIHRIHQCDLGIQALQLPASLQRGM